MSDRERWRLFYGIVSGCKTWVSYGRSESGNPFVNGLHIVADDGVRITSRTLRDLQIGRIPMPGISGSAAECRRQLDALGPLRRPDNRRYYPDEFFAEVAARHRLLRVTTRSPASVFAAEADVPIATAHRWIREARLRGLLQSSETDGRPRRRRLSA
jgi:hypothetical protein